MMLLIGLTESRAQAPIPQQSESGVDTRSIAIVARFSRELFVDLTRDKIEMTLPIDQRVDNTQLVGEASGTGTTTIELPPSDELAMVVLRVQGDAVGRLNGDVGPASIRVSSRAQFNSTLKLRFDGRSFSADPATSHSENCTSVDSICAKRRGPVGCLVERIGRRIATKSLPELNRYAEQATEDVLNSTVDEQSTQLLEELNRSSQFDEIVDKHFPETRDWVYHLATRQDFLVAGLGPQSESTPAFLLDSQSPPKALMELWLRLTPGQAAMLEILDNLNVTNDLLRGFLPENDSNDLAADVQVDRQGEWSILRVGLFESERDIDRIEPAAN